MVHDRDVLLRLSRKFAQTEVRPLAAYFDEGNGIDRSLIYKMGKIGLLGTPIPAIYGGQEADPVLWGRITSEIGKACCSVRAVLTVHTAVVGETINRLGSEYQKKHWLPLMCSGEAIGAFALSEPKIGSDARNVSTTYQKHGEQYVLNGQKKWISLGGIADFFIVIAAFGDKVSAFIVNASAKGVETHPIKGLIGNRGTHVAEINLTDVIVPAENLLGGEGMGFSHVVNAAMDFGRYSIAWGGLAVAEEALESMVSYARSRKQFGMPIGNISAIRRLIAEATVGVHATRQLCYSAGKMRMENSMENVNETIIAKYFASKTAVDVTNNAVQLHGANGCTSDFKVERLLREAKILEVIEGTSQVLEDVIADFSLRQYYNKL